MKFQQTWLLVGLVAMTGCAQIKKAHEPHLDPAPIQPVMAQANPDFSEDPRTAGSIFTSSHGSLFSDDKAYRQGDIVMVRVTQNTRGSKSASTDASRSTDISGNIRYLMGLEDEINRGYGRDNRDARFTDSWEPTNLIEASAGSDFSGDGSVNRQDTLQATVSAIVTEVLNNGNLVVYGSEHVTINNESSMLTVQGIVRPFDINVDNEVDSTRIANARIEFVGDGVVSEKQHPGWLTRTFDYVWPF